MRNLSYETWNAIPSAYREYRSGRCYILLAGKMRPVMLRMPMMPLIGEPRIVAVITECGRTKDVMRDGSTRCQQEHTWTSVDTCAALARAIG